MSYRDEQDQRKDDLIEKVLGIGAVIGAGAFLYRSGGGELLSNVLSRAGKAFRESSRVLSSRTLDEIHGNGKEVFNEVKKEFKESLEKHKDDKITLDIDNNKSVLNPLFEAFKNRARPKDLSFDLYNREVFNPSVKNGIKSILGDLNENEADNFVEQILSNQDEMLHVMTDLDNKNMYFFTDKAKEEFNFIEPHKKELEDFITKRLNARRQESEDFVIENEGFVNDVIQKLENKEALAKRFGTNQSESLINDAIGDSQLTLGQLIDNREKFEDITIENGEKNKDAYSFLDYVQSLIEKDSSYRDINVSENLRITDDNEIRDFTFFNGVKEKLDKEFMHTTPGRLMKRRETVNAIKNAPNFLIHARGENDYLLSSIGDGNDIDNTLSNTYVNILGNIYKRTFSDVPLQKIDNTEGMYLTNGRYGFQARMMRRISGEEDQFVKERSKIEEWLDFDSPHRKILDKIKSYIGKDENEMYLPNILKEFMSDDRDTFAEDDPVNVRRKSKRLVKEIENYSKDISDTTVARVTSALEKGSYSDDLKELTKLLTLNNEQLFEATKKSDVAKNNIYIHDILKQYLKDPYVSKHRISVKERMVDIGFSREDITEVEQTATRLRKEIMQSILAGIGGYNKEHAIVTNADDIYTFIDALKLSKKDDKSLKALATSSIIKNSLVDFHENRAMGKEQMNFFKSDVDELFTSGSGRRFKEALIDTVREATKANTRNTVIKASDIVKAKKPNEYMYARKGISVRDIIQSDNMAEKAKAYVKQFYAGKDNIGDVTDATLFPYFMIDRLYTSLPGLGFSIDNRKNVIDYAKNTVLKRVVPIGLGFTALSYANFEAKNIFGKSFTEIGLNGLANVDIGIRKILASNPIVDNALKNRYYTSDISYYRHADPFMNAEERKDFYETGSTPVRKGRYWSMSTSEWRGGKIDYFEPNSLKQASVDWRAISSYGSADEKWKHSWIPTPRHPLSPIRRLLDPYYLEKKNRYSRPYPVTAPMFGENSPWSAPLNATIGKIFKPQKNIHKGVLGNDHVDVRDLIAKQNEITKNKAEHNEFISLTQDNAATEPFPEQGLGYGDTNVIYPDSNDTTSKASWIKGDSTSGYVKAYQSENGEVLYYGNEKSNRKSNRDINRQNLMSQIEMINANIKNKSNSKGESSIGYAKRLQYSTARETIDLLRNKSIKHDFADMSSTQQMIREMSYSGQELAGMYGFLANTFYPRSKTHVLENASKMSSFSQSFFDEHIGGVGGDFMEVARRFFPKSNGDNIEVNPLRNNMPDWLPDRFKHGDPYTLVKKGALRLPGKAYEAVNHVPVNIDFRLNPHMIGASTEDIKQYYLNKKDLDNYFNSLGEVNKTFSDHEINQTIRRAKKAEESIKQDIRKGKINTGNFYDDFTKFKILADVDPNSDEYKEYRYRVKNMNLSDKQKRELKVIERHVDRQKAQHEFYPYRYSKVPYHITNAVINEVKGNTFTVLGSDKIYSMAGLNMTGNDLSKHLMSGMKVSLKTNKDDEQNSIVKAVVYKDKENMNKELANTYERSEDRDPIDAIALTTGGQQFRGAIMEKIEHAPIPFIHNKFLKMDTALESYKNEQVYGDVFPTWEHPIQGYIKPAFYKTMAVSPIHASIGALSFAANIYIKINSNKIESSKIVERTTDIAKKVFGEAMTKQRIANYAERAVKVANLITTPGAAAGATVGFGIKLNHQFTNIGATIGSSIWAGSYLMHNAKNPIISAGAGAVLGHAFGEFWEKSTGPKYLKYGALLGLGISFIRNPELNLKEMTSTYIPKETKKRWELEEYFDRLKYIKYDALYNKASIMAIKKDGIDIKGILEDREKNKKKLERLSKFSAFFSNKTDERNQFSSYITQKINEKMYNIENGVTKVRATEYVKSALAYKQARDSTIYGLNKNSTWAEILRALPKQDRDYFLDFAKTNNRKERKKILKVISPYKRRILQNIWGEEVDKVESNSKFFKTHKMPGIFWKGWRPTTDLDQVEIKTIENEGMQLSDFGFYDNQKYEPNMDNTTGIRQYNSPSLLHMRSDLINSLTGLGLTGVNVSIEPSNKPGIQMIADFTRMTEFKIKQGIYDKLGKTYY